MFRVLDRVLSTFTVLALALTGSCGYQITKNPTDQTQTTAASHVAEQTSVSSKSDGFATSIGYSFEAIKNREVSVLVIVHGGPILAPPIMVKEHFVVNNQEANPSKSTSYRPYTGHADVRTDKLVLCTRKPGGMFLLKRIPNEEGEDNKFVFSTSVDPDAVTDTKMNFAAIVAESSKETVFTWFNYHHTAIHVEGVEFRNVDSKAQSFDAKNPEGYLWYVPKSAFRESDPAPQ